MEDVLVYITFIVSIYILYLALKMSITMCKSDIPKPPKKEEEPIKVSDIFRSMFSDEAIRPGHAPLV
jgi:hypothetical protein